MAEEGLEERQVLLDLDAEHAAGGVGEELGGPGHLQAVEAAREHVVCSVVLPSGAVQVRGCQQGIHMVGVVVQQLEDLVGVIRGLRLLEQPLGHLWSGTAS